jgi:hypothetical protein
MPTPQRLPEVNGDDGTWGNILVQYLQLQHFNFDNGGLGDPRNGTHVTVTIQPGTTAPGTAPLQFNSGPVLTTPEDGSVEYDGTHYWATIGSTRYQLDQQSGGGSGITRSISSISSATNAGATASTDYVYLVSGTTTLTLPTAASNTNRYTVTNTGTNTVTVATTSSQTIDGSSTATLPIANMSLDFVSNGSNWVVE